jgi:hypothetical protein
MNSAVQIVFVFSISILLAACSPSVNVKNTDITQDSIMKMIDKDYDPDPSHFLRISDMGRMTIYENLAFIEQELNYLIANDAPRWDYGSSIPISNELYVQIPRKREGLKEIQFIVNDSGFIKVIWFILKNDVLVSHVHSWGEINERFNFGLKVDE